MDAGQVKVAVLGVVLAVGSGCGTFSKRVGSKTTEGALTELQQGIMNVPEEQQGIIAERNSKAAVRGALDELSDPVRQQQLSDAIAIAVARALRTVADPSRAPHLAADMEGTGVGGSGSPYGPPPLQTISRELALGIAAELTRQLGPEGDGPLSVAMGNSAGQLTASATKGILDQLVVFSGPCPENDPDKCLDQRVHRLGAAAASGALEAIRLPLMVAVFAAGFLCSLILHAVWTRSRRRHHSDVHA